MAKVKTGMAAIFKSEADILKAAKQVSSSGYKKFDVISPYPIHGMEEACNIKRSWIPWVTFFAGLTGLASGLALTWWTSAVDWPLNVGGKPFFSLPAFIPIMFELTILFAALCSVASLFYACGIPTIDPPTIDPDLSCHKFAVFIPSDDSGYDEKKVEAFLKGLGAAEVKKTQH